MMKFAEILGSLCTQFRLGWRRALNFLLIGFLLVINSVVVKGDAIQILLPDGEPAVGANVQLRSVEWDGSKAIVKVQAVEVDETGYVDVQNVVGKTSSQHSVLIVDHPDAAIGLWNFGVKGKLKLAPSFKVSGKLVGVDGSPVSQGSVRLLIFGSDTYSGIYEPLFRDFSSFAATVDKNGKFEFRGATLNGYDFPPGARLLGEGNVDGQRFVGLVRNSFAGDSKIYLNSDGKTKRKQDPLIELVVHPLGTVSGAVVNGHDDTPAGGVEIRVGVAGYDGETTIRTKLDGTFELKDVPTYHRRSFAVGQYSLIETKALDRQINVSGLRLPIYPMKVQASKLVNSDSGKPPVIPLQLGYRQELKVGSGWTLQRAGSWGGIGMEAKTKPDGSFKMSLPTGPFVFTVKAPRSNAHGAYDWSGALNLAADEELPAEFPVQRAKGILFKTVLAGEPKLNDPIWRTFVVSIKTERGWKYARKSPLWFVSVKEWGDEVELQVKQRPEGQERRTLIDSIKFTAENKSWPIEIEFPGAVLGK